MDGACLSLNEIDLIKFDLKFTEFFSYIEHIAPIDNCIHSKIKCAKRKIAIVYVRAQHVLHVHCTVHSTVVEI